MSQTLTSPPKNALDFYATAGEMTSPGTFAPLIAELPDDPLSIIRAIPGLVIHEFLAEKYGFKVPNARRRESHLRRADQMLARLVALDPSPLTTERPPAERLVGICRHFEVLLATFMRVKRIPIRVRRGFGTYFNPTMTVDHEISEYWNESESRWIRVDAQLDDVQRNVLQIDFDPLEVPTDRFINAAKAWEDCRAGRADPDKFGIFGLRGLWFVAGNLIRDVAWLNKHELLPWDVWGGMPRQDEPISDDDLEFFDRLARLTRDPDANFDELQALYAGDDRVRVPSRVFNANLNREELV
jgi:hypothetical protein